MLRFSLQNNTDSQFVTVFLSIQHIKMKYLIFFLFQGWSNSFHISRWLKLVDWILQISIIFLDNFILCLVPGKTRENKSLCNGFCVDEI